MLDTMVFKDSRFSPVAVPLIFDTGDVSSKILIVTSHSKIAIFRQDGAREHLTLLLQANCLSRLCLLREFEAMDCKGYLSPQTSLSASATQTRAGSIYSKTFNRLELA